jgi:hypothetical protein
MPEKNPGGKGDSFAALPLNRFSVEVASKPRFSSAPDHLQPLAGKGILLIYNRLRQSLL